MSSFFAPKLRLDFTKDNLFTLSENTNKILKKLEKPIELHFFLSENLLRNAPGFTTYARRVSQLLDEIVNKSNKNIILHRYNPKPYSLAEDKANNFGIQSIPIESAESIGYFGLAGINGSGNVELIEFFQQNKESYLEYDIMHLINKLTKYKKDVIGIMSSLPVMGDTQTLSRGLPTIPWEVITQLRQNFDVINLPQEIDDLPKSINTLVVIHPRAMNDRSIYELEQFLFRGGKAILFIDPKAETGMSFDPKGLSSSSNGLKKLFDVWNIEVPENQLVADQSMALHVNGGTIIKPVLAKYLAWLGVSPKYMEQNDPVTSQLTILNIATSGYIKYNENTPLTIKPLITSSKNSGLIKATDVEGIKPDVFGLLKIFKQDDKKYVLAARLTGEVESAFKNGIPARIVKKSTDQLTQEPETIQLMKSNNSLNVILVADSDLLQDKFWNVKRQIFGRTVNQEISDNGKFFINAIENLTGSDELLKLRARSYSARSFEKIKYLEQLAQTRFQHKQRELYNQLKETQLKITTLEGVKAIENLKTKELEVTVDLTEEQRNEIKNMRNKMFETRKKLRAIQLKLNEDVDNLKSFLEFVNIGLVPILITIFATLAVVVRRVIFRRRNNI